VQLLEGMRVDALILTPTAKNRRHLARLIDEDIVIVQVDRRVEGLDADAILVDNEAGAAIAVAHLIEAGHTRIGILTGELEVLTASRRLAGYERAMADAKLEPRAVPGGFEYEAGYEAVLRIFAAGAVPDAIVGANDEVAIGVLRGLRQAGVDVPAQVSVAGIDDTRPARFLDLTTVNVPLYELGATAARAIVGEGGLEESEIVLSHRLVPRSTTARRRR
jgi:LacI family transcriptional regulator